MKLPVRTTNAMLLGNGLIAHIRTVQEYRKRHDKPPQRPYLTYTQLVEQTGAKLALVGIGNFLGEVMVAIHVPGVPDAIQGLTLFVTPKDGQIDFSKGAEEWYDITPRNALQFRQAVLDFDWSGIEFAAQNEG